MVNHKLSLVNSALQWQMEASDNVFSISSYCTFECFWKELIPLCSGVTALYLIQWQMEASDEFRHIYALPLQKEASNFTTNYYAINTTIAYDTITNRLFSPNQANATCFPLTLPDRIAFYLNKNKLFQLTMHALH